MGEEGTRSKESDFNLTSVKDGLSCSALPVVDWNHLDKKHIHYK